MTVWTMTTTWDFARYDKIKKEHASVEKGGYGIGPTYVADMA